MVHSDNRKLMVKSGPVRPIIDFAQFIAGFTGLDLITKQTV